MIRPRMSHYRRTCRRKRREHLTATFKQNGYLLPYIGATSSIQVPSTPPEEEEPDDKEEEKRQPLAVIPYVSGVSGSEGPVRSST